MGVQYISLDSEFDCFSQFVYDSCSGGLCPRFQRREDEVRLNHGAVGDEQGYGGKLTTS